MSSGRAVHVSSVAARCELALKERPYEGVDAPGAFGISWVRYRHQLLRLVRRPDVLEEYPILAHRAIRTISAGMPAGAAREMIV